MIVEFLPETEGEGVPLPGTVAPPQEDVQLLGMYYGKTKAPTDNERLGYPLARPVDGQPGMVESPYGGHTVDVSRIPSDTIVIDPKFSVESGKFFRI